MILLIESSLNTFKAVEFREGLNIILADRTFNATEKQTRNSAGKTSLIEVIHFLYGSDCDKDSLFRTAALNNHYFKGTFLIAGDKFVISRSGCDPSKIFLEAGGEARNDIPTKIDKKTEKIIISNVNWRIFLGHSLFGMPSNLQGSIFNESFTPSFRSLFGYFVRRKNSGGFISLERQAEKQQRWDWQVSVSYLLGFDWKIPFEFNKIRIREKTLEELKKAIKSGALGNVVGKVSELRPLLTVAEAKAEKLHSELTNFEVLDAYKQFSRRAGAIKEEMQVIGRKAVSLNETLEHINASLQSERPPQRTDLKNLYSAAGIELPGVVLRRFAEVEIFYESVIRNRKIHLTQEISIIREKISDGENKLAILDKERSEILKILEGRGALNDFLLLQRNLADSEAVAAELREKFKTAEILEGETTQLDIDRSHLKKRLREDHQLRKAALSRAILIIADAISELYEDRTGRFIVDATDNGPEFKIHIEGDRGGGISNIEIFCFDLALLKIVTTHLGGPGFLVHDSHLFDGVDERQIAKALLLGFDATENKGLQYIVTMNSDIFDRVPLSKKIDRTKVVLKTRISDETETGGLFGFRFD